MITLLALLAGCGQDPLQGTLSQNVGQSFAPCSEAEIKYMASRHNLMTAFDPCGSNKFQYFAWSPKGTHLYFQLVMTGYIMNADADNRETIPVPMPEPQGPATWLSATRLAVPVGPEEGKEALRFGIFDLEQKSVFYREVPDVSKIADPVALDNANLAFIGTTATGSQVLRLNIEDSSLQPAFPWLTGAATSLTFTAGSEALTVGRDSGLTAYQVPSGDILGTWTDATRGQVSPDGEWIALEFEGPEISIFYQRSWDELSEGARAREVQRVEQFEERLPEGYPTMVRPPTLGFQQLSTGRRWTFSGALGYRFQWYPATPGWASFMLWGFEGKQYKRNVALGNFNDRLRAVADGRLPMGMEVFEADITAPSEAGAATATTSPDAEEK